MIGFMTRLMATILFAALFSSNGAFAQISQVDLRADVQAWRDWMESTHPDISHSVRPSHLGSVFDDVIAEISGVYDARRAWWELATINPVLNDAHTGIRLPEEAYQAALDGGAIAFTLPVSVSGDRLFVTGDTGITVGDGDELVEIVPGQEIVAINGEPVGRLVDALVPRMRGETRALRERVLSLRFPIALWAMQGNRDHHTVTLAGSDAPIRVSLPHSSALEVPDRGPFGLDVRANAAILRVDSFDPAREDEFATFLTNSFAHIQACEVELLIIDIRENGGGGRQLSDRLLAYLTTERYTPISAVKARIVAENQALVPGSEIGQVIEMPFAQWVEPPTVLADRFEGRAVVLVGPASYSQAIAFGVIVQDFDIAEVAGSPTEGAANQTGQVQRFELPNSGLAVQAPLYIFTRPSGETGSSPLTPDRIVPGTGEEQLVTLITDLTD